MNDDPEFRAKVKRMAQDATADILRTMKIYTLANEARVRWFEAAWSGLEPAGGSLEQRLAEVEARLLAIEMKVMGGPPPSPNP